MNLHLQNANVLPATHHKQPRRHVISLIRHRHHALWQVAVQAGAHLSSVMGHCVQDTGRQYSQTLGIRSLHNFDMTVWKSDGRCFEAVKRREMHASEG